MGGGGWESKVHEVGTGRAQTRDSRDSLGKEKALPTLVAGRQIQLWVGFKAGEVKEVVLIACGLCSHDKRVGRGEVRGLRTVEKVLDIQRNE